MPGEPTISTPFGYLAAQALELGGIPQEIDDLGDLFLGFLDAGHVIERDVDLIFAEQARPTLAEGHGAASAASRPASGA